MTCVLIKRDAVKPNWTFNVAKRLNWNQEAITLLNEDRTLQKCISPATAAICIPPEIIKQAEETLGAFFEPISRSERSRTVADHLDPQKSLKRAEILQRYTPLRSKKLLEVGSGFGTNLAVWMKEFGIDGYGIEPDSIGFGSSFSASRIIFETNDLDPGRIIDGHGENLPFEDESFDIVYSANVLEHTESPERVLSECFRVTVYYA